MPEELYRKLARHLDKLPGSFPQTESGVEIRIVKRYFTPEEAELCLHLNLISEEARVVARRAGIKKEEAAKRLEAMAKKRLIFRIEETPGKPLYMPNQFVIGFWEFGVNDLDEDKVRDFNEYIPTLLNYDVWSKAPQLRTIPIGRSMSPELRALPYEKAEDIVRLHKRFGVAPCICRREMKIAGEEVCDRPEDTCLVFGMAADYYIRNGIGREITFDQTMDILKLAEEKAMVLQPSGYRDAINICCCCGCCCGVLRNIRKQPKPAEIVSSGFVVSVDKKKCEGCGLCIERCQMDALRLEKEKISLNIDRCIGCGLCVTACPTESLTLNRKSKDQQPEVPQDAIKAAMGQLKARGKFSVFEMGKYILKSKWDRLMAPK